MMNTAQPTVNTSPAAAEMKVATTGQRFMTFFLDVIFYYLAAFAVLFVIDRFLPGDRVLYRQDYVFGIILFFLYYILQEAIYGRTLGKVITGTKVVNENGSPISFGQALVRTLCRLIPFEPFSFFGGKGHPVGWHDRIAKTRVIDLGKQ